MSWENRLRGAAYNSPSGKRLAFDFENLSTSMNLDGTAFKIPDANGTYVQRSGVNERTYPMRVFLWGTDCDIEADAFDEALRESGIGKLEHPMYGTKNVVPFGAVTRRDDLKTAANQVIIDVTFWETIDVIFPSSQGDPASAVLTSVDGFNNSLADQFDQLLNIDTASLRASFSNSYEALLGGTRSGLQSVANVNDSVGTQFNAIFDSIDQSIDSLINDPITLAFQTTQLIQSPARSVANIRDKLSAYGNLTQSILGIDSQDTSAKTSNAFHTNDVYASTYVTGSVVSAVNTQFETKTEALQAADVILEQLDAVVEWRDSNYESLEQIDTGEAYQKLHQSVALCAGFLVEISFSLKQERSEIPTN